MTETTIQAGIQDTIQSMTEFDNAVVVINDYSIYDDPISQAPYVLIESADDFFSRQDAPTDETTYMIPVTLIERFTDWKATLDGLTTRRDAILTKYNAAGAARSANGITATTIDVIRPDGPIAFVYDAYIAENERSEALPVFVAHRLIFEATEY